MSDLTKLGATATKGTREDSGIEEYGVCLAKNVRPGFRVEGMFGVWLTVYAVSLAGADAVLDLGSGCEMRIPAHTWMKVKPPDQEPGFGT